MSHHDKKASDTAVSEAFFIVPKTTSSAGGKKLKLWTKVKTSG